MSKILILGKTGSGKSTSIGEIPELNIKGLDPKETFIISCVNKPLPFKNSSQLYKCVNYDSIKKDGKIIIPQTEIRASIIEILKTGNRLIARDAFDIAITINILNNSKYKNIVIDDLNYISQDYYMRNAKKGGWDIPKDIGYNMNLIFEAINNCPETKNIIALAHFEEYKDKNGDSLSYKFKTTGSMVDNYITPEGKFEVVLYLKLDYNIDTKKSSRSFVTNFDGMYPAKSPVGLFENLYIPNDLGYVVEKITQYYGE